VPTQVKVEAVEELKSHLSGAKTVVLTEYRGLTVAELSELRKQLRQVSARYTVVKNRLARIAVSSSTLEALAPHLKGPTGMVVSTEDPVAVAKTLQTFGRTHQALAIKAGIVDGQTLDTSGLKALADLPSKDALRAQLVGMVQGPLAQLVALLQAPQREIAYVLSERGRAVAEANTGQGT
jgi:large subunit ribosomal protein L10